MDTIGLDLHKRESQLCIGHDDGTTEERRIATTRERLTAVLGDRPRARVLVEASTESEWAARHLEQLGHEVIVADPNFAPMYATRSRRTKTDRRDARALMEACRLGAYRRAHRLSDERRHVRAELAVREALVRTRSRYIGLAKALVRRDGLRVASPVVMRTWSPSASPRSSCRPTWRPSSCPCSKCWPRSTSRSPRRSAGSRRSSDRPRS